MKNRRNVHLFGIVVIIAVIGFTMIACKGRSGNDNTFDPVAQIGETTYTTLQEAVDAAEESDTITILKDITLTEPVTVTITKGFGGITIDLNGNTLDGGSGTAIQHNGTGILGITDSTGGGRSTGTVTASTAGFAVDTGIINGGCLIVSGDAMIKSVGSGKSIYNDGGEIWVTEDSTVLAISGGIAIMNNGYGTVIVEGGAVGSIGDGGLAIVNTVGTVTVLDGAVYSDDDNSFTIMNTNECIVNIGGGSIRCDGDNSYAVFNYGGTITIGGGTIRNNNAREGVAISNELGGGTITITVDEPSLPYSAPITVIGGTSAFDIAPAVSATGVKVTASANTDGSQEASYNAANIGTYKYVRFEEGL